MLNRQKTLLALLVMASRGVTKLELTKWAFLIRNEMPSGGGSAFYDFLPYKFGPFSFCLYREMDGLVRDGYVESKENSRWFRTDLAEDAIDSLPRDVYHDVRRIVERFKGTRSDSLIDYVYERYPSFTVNSELKVLANRVIAVPAVYTAGYEQLSVDAFLNRLVENGIQRIIDVRNNPVARRYGFHKGTLLRLAGHVGIDYVHAPELGIQSAKRQSLHTHDDYQSLFDEYEHDTIRVQAAAVDRVAALVQERASVLVCMEADPICCHRSRLADAVAERTGLRIQDLGHF